MEFLFAKRDGCKISFNRFVEMRFMQGVDVPKERTECVPWKKKSCYLSVLKKQIHCRRFVYDVCVADIPEHHCIVQICRAATVCVNPSHLRCVPYGRRLSNRPKWKEEPDWMTFYSISKQKSSIVAIPQETTDWTAWKEERCAGKKKHYTEKKTCFLTEK